MSATLPAGGFPKKRLHDLPQGLLGISGRVVLVDLRVM